MTILLTTPYLDEAERCSRVALLMKGRILNLDTPAALRKSGTGSVIEVLAAPKRQAADLLSGFPGVEALESFGERLHATVPSVTGSAASALAAEIETMLQTSGLNVTGVRATTPSLEDIFISRIRHHETPEGRTS
jgi:ABC-2 type transport system ATP-binding protein